MRPRILPPLILLGSVLLSGAYFFSLRQNHALQQALEAAGLKNQQQQATIGELETTQAGDRAQLLVLDANLGTTKTRLTAAEADQVVLNREIRDLRIQLQAQAAQAALLTRENDQLDSALTAARAQRASAESVHEYEATISKLEQALAAAQTVLVNPAPVPAPGVLLTTNRSRSSTVVSVGPTDAFVVVNYGANHGAMPTQHLAIKRGTEILATALISDVRENYSIAQVQPQSLRGALHKGDSAVLAQ